MPCPSPRLVPAPAAALPGIFGDSEWHERTEISYLASDIGNRLGYLDGIHSVFVSQTGWATLDSVPKYVTPSGMSVVHAVNLG